ncbi:MAG: phasin family protein [Sphingosinicella sp.]|uniref:phasin family protein n=1 Tax=Sphingosinicella sp. TaxID=1917971 RepID=UPI004037D5C4
MADTVAEKKATDAAPAVPKDEAAALKSAEAAFAQASEAIAAPVVKAAAPAPAKAPVVKASAKPARKAKAKPAAAKKAAPAKRVTARKASKSTTTKSPARAAAKTIKQGATIMNQQTRKAADTAKTAADQIKNVFGDVNERAKSAMERSAKIAEELADLTRGNVEALVASSKVAAKGVEGLSQDAAEYSRKSFEEASATLKSFAEVKSPTDFFRLQSDYARSAFDAAVAESARVSEAMIKLAGDAAEPITSRYTVAAERVKTLAA